MDILVFGELLIGLGWGEWSFGIDFVCFVAICLEENFGLGFGLRFDIVGERNR